MQDNSRAIAALGNEPPLVGDGRSGPPDRREVSARWLSGTFLTGITSSVLMGVALLVALDGREQLATPPEIANLTMMGAAAGKIVKAGRVVAPRAVAKAKDRRRMEVSTVQRSGDRDVIRTLPFVHVKMALAAGHSTSRPYPNFDPLDVFAEDGAAQTASTPTGLIYGAKVESEVSLRTVDFPVETAAFDETSELNADEVEQVVRTNGAILTDGAVMVAALHYVDPQRFGQSLALQTINASLGVRIVQENVSVSTKQHVGAPATEFAEDIIPFTTDKDIGKAFLDAGYSERDSAGMVEALTKLMSAPALKAGTVLCVGIETRGERSRIVRASVYSGKQHVLTIAVNDRNQFVPGDAPETNPEVLTAFDDSQPVHVRGDLPTVYDGVYRAAYSYGLNRAMTKQLIKLLASDVDYQARLNPSDRLQVFFSKPDESDAATDESELLFVSATFGGATRNFYRFQMEDGTIDYFDQDGRSARQFLLRTPVPTGKFRSGFGMRRHPVLGYSRMHTGVDWSAPTGTPIIASGNGIVDKAGWAAGYGRQTIIRHANGYETSYNHQSAIAEGVVPGARVRQGQVIGYVGASGLTTGAHLHYELMVNGAKVDPMRVRLPVSRVLKAEELETFQRERARIDELLKDEADGALKMASALR
jgi:murein DD-endopeptidase MepM/ murein hydrolase activator NlpD